MITREKTAHQESGHDYCEYYAHYPTLTLFTLEDRNGMQGFLEK